MNKKEALKIISAHPFLFCGFPDDVIEALNMAVRELKREPRKGHWKHNKCDVCGASRPPLFDNFCPNCGVDMRGEEV